MISPLPPIFTKRRGSKDSVSARARRASSRDSAAAGFPRAARARRSARVTASRAPPAAGAARTPAMHKVASISAPGAEPREAAFGLVEGRVLLAEGEPHEMPPVGRVVEEGRSRHRRHADLLDQMPHEGDVVVP